MIVLVQALSEFYIKYLIKLLSRWTSQSTVPIHHFTFIYHHKIYLFQAEIYLAVCKQLYFLEASVIGSFIRILQIEKEA